MHIDDDDESPASAHTPEVRELPSSLVFGGVVIRPDGTQEELPETETLPVVIPLWTMMPEHDPETVAACIEFAVHPYPAIRLVAIDAFGSIARRGGTLIPRDRVVERVQAGLHDQNEGVRNTAKQVADVLERQLGWLIIRQ